MLWNCETALDSYHALKRKYPDGVLWKKCKARSVKRRGAP